MTPKVLLLGTSFSAMPFLLRLLRQGYEVFVCGKHPGDPCHEHATGSYYLDYSDPEAVLAVARQQDFVAIVPTCNDASYWSGALAAAELGLPGYDSPATTRIVHVKSEFRQFTQTQAIPAPLAFRHLAGAPLVLPPDRYPLLVKPVDNFSGNGMSLVQSAAELDTALERAFQATREPEVLIEEYVTGSLHSHSAFIEGGRIHLDFFADEYCTVYPYQVNCSNCPSQLTVAMQTAVRSTIETLVRKLGLVDGLLHTQFMQNGERHWIIECMRRCPGDLYNLMIEQATGLDYSSYFLNGFLGRKHPQPEPVREKFIARHTISSDHERIFTAFTQRIPSTQVISVPLMPSGHQLRAAPADKAAILFAEFDDRQALWDVAPRLAELTTIIG